VSAPLPLPQAPQPYILHDIAVPQALLRDLPGIAMTGGMEGGLVRTSLGVAAGRICAPGEIAEALQVPAGGWTALPRLVEPHVHLDKSDTIAETGAGDGTLMGAIGTMGAAMRDWDDAHYAARMTRAVKEALTAGVGAMRTHIDCMDLPEEQPGWRAISEVAGAFAGRMQITPVALAALDRTRAENFDTRCAQVARAGGVLGAFIGPDGADPDLLDAFLTGAERHGLDVDFHVDEHLRAVPSATVALAEAVLRTGFAGRVLAGHTCRLGLMDAEELDRAVDVIARSGIAVASLPRTNLYLQDRQAGRTPTRRGMAPIHELAARGVPVVFGTDNVRDAFFPFGGYDLLNLFADAAYSLHLDDDLGGWLRAVTDVAADMLGLDGAGSVRAGGAADLVLLPARNWSAVLTTRPEDRTILIGGRESGQSTLRDLPRKEAAS